MPLKKTSLIILVSFLFFSLTVQAILAVENTKSQVTEGLDITAKEAGISDETDGEAPDLASALGTAINYLFAVVGLVFLTLILIGGFLWMSASGNEEGIKKAKTLILNAIFGLMVIFFAYALVWLILNALKGATFPPA